jgi:phosphoribosylformylglycinamidine cyclo-ligase
MSDSLPHSAYATAGVDTRSAGSSVGRLAALFHPTFAFPRAPYRPLLPLGHYANVIDLGGGKGLAVSTDGVGTKLLVAQKVGRFDTVGIDCVAMNVNDLLCVGAEPVTFLDYIACESADPDLLHEVAKGIAEGARQARVAVPGGEIAQVKEMIRGEGDGKAIDLVGTAMGIVDNQRIVTGKGLVPGDVLLGIPSSGLHSNGYTLARRIFFEKAGLSVGASVKGLDRTVGEELLEPTRIYVSEVVGLFEEKIEIHGLAHITGDGLLNLRRLDADVGYDIERMPDSLPIFEVLARLGKVEPTEMYEVFNMGLGFVAMVPESQADRALEILSRPGTGALRIGTVTDDPKRTVQIRPAGLRSGEGGFEAI